MINIETLVFLLYLFFVYAFLGWVVEVVFHVITVGHFINRGFLNGPYCPIYGFGMIFILTLLTPFMNNIALLFLFSIILTTAIELFAGFILEKFFKERWWDYSDLPFNFHGYICVKFSLFWGLGALIVVKFVHPTVDYIYNYLPKLITLAFVIIMALMMLIDISATITNILKLNKELKELEELSKKIKALSDNIGNKISDTVLNTIENKKELEEKRKNKTRQIAKNHRRVLRAFPNLKSKHFDSALNNVKSILNNKKK